MTTTDRLLNTVPLNTCPTVSKIDCTLCVKHLQEHFRAELEAKKDCRLISLILMRKLLLWQKQEKPDMAVDPVNQMVTRLEIGWGQEQGTRDPHQTMTCQIGCHHHQAEETGVF